MKPKKFLLPLAALVTAVAGAPAQSSTDQSASGFVPGPSLSSKADVSALKGDVFDFVLERPQAGGMQMAQHSSHYSHSSHSSHSSHRSHYSSRW